MLSRPTNRELLVDLAPVALAVTLLLAPTALLVLLVFPSRRFTTAAIATFGASTAVAATALGAMFVSSLP